MAVQLARLSLWLTTLAADRPLSFLDHHLVVGDSLAGAWLENLRRPPRPGRRQRAGAVLPLFDNDPAGRGHSGRLPDPVLARDDAEPYGRTGPRERARVRRAERERTAAVLRWKRVANLWCAVWFDDRCSAASLRSGAGCGLVAAVNAAAAHVFGLSGPGGRAGRDAAVPALGAGVSGGVLRLSGPAARTDRVRRDYRQSAVGHDARRRSRRRARCHARPPASTVRFTRESGVYSAQSDGHANRYQLFRRARNCADAERRSVRTCAARRAGRRSRQRIAAGARSSRVLRSMRSSAWTTRGGFFRSIAACGFCCYGDAGDRTKQSRGALWRRRASRPLARRRRCRPPGAIRITSETLQQLSGPSLDIPDLRHPLDLVILEQAVSLFPPLGAEEGWDAHFGRELNATEDRAAFRADPTGSSHRGRPASRAFRVALDRSSRSIRR